eukprot:811376-Pelagomonas_calceolata.AAC.2
MCFTVPRASGCTSHKPRVGVKCTAAGDKLEPVKKEQAAQLAPSAWTAEGQGNGTSTSSSPSEEAEDTLADCVCKTTKADMGFPEGLSGHPQHFTNQFYHALQTASFSVHDLKNGLTLGGKECHQNSQGDSADMLNSSHRDQEEAFGVQAKPTCVKLVKLRPAGHQAPCIYNSRARKGAGLAAMPLLAQFQLFGEGGILC